MADTSNCLFLGGWTSLNDLTDNFSFIPSDEVFFLALKRKSGSLWMTGILVFRQYGYYATVIRDYYAEYDTQASFNTNYMSKNDLINWFNGPSGIVYLYSLTEEEKETFFNILENDE